MDEIEAWRAKVLLAIQKLRETAPKGYPAQAILDEWEETIKYARLEPKA